MLTKSPGWSEDDVPPARQYGLPSSSNTAVHIRPSTYLAPHAEILSLIEGFIKLKGEVASKFYALIADNYDLIRSVSNVLINKIATLHAFSLTGIQILRRIVEFAIRCLSQWEITIPASSNGGAPYPTYGTPSTSAGNFQSNDFY